MLAREGEELATPPTEVVVVPGQSMLVLMEVVGWHSLEQVVLVHGQVGHKGYHSAGQDEVDCHGLVWQCFPAAVPRLAPCLRVEEPS